MLTVYMNDIEGFDREDWADMLDNPNVPLFMNSPYEDWQEGKQVVFDVLPDGTFFGEWESCPVSKFAFDMEGEGESIAYSEELSDLLRDLVSLRELKREVYRMNLFDRELEAEMDNVSNEFGGAYDRALARALLMLLKELCKARA